MGELGDFALEFKRHSRAKRMKLRYDASRDRAIITMPPRSSEREATKFAQKHISWLEKQRRCCPERIYLLPGNWLPLRGIPRLIIHDPDQSGRVKLEGNKILVGGPLEGFSKRLENYFKKQARSEIEPMAAEMANEIGGKFRRVQIRDPKSRWGSCSTSGTLSFSWRLILTPPEILEYVVAHEVAHLKEMNHSKAFWHVVDCLVNDAKISRAWLKGEGQQLMLILNQSP